jgi:hypothetical protein
VSRAVRLVVALYPRAVRDRYGPEIADLLTHSRRPVRDLADVARCALAERTRMLTYARLRPHLHATTGLVAAPMAFAGAYLMLYFLGGWQFFAVAAVVDSLTSAEAGLLFPAAVTLPVAAGAIWLAGHARLPFTPALAPAGLAVGALPLVPLLTDTGRLPMAAAIVCWSMTTGVLSTVAVALAHRGHRRRAVLTMALGGLLACELAFAVYGLSTFGSAAVAVGAYPVTTLGLDPGMMGDPAGRVADAMTIIPALLTSCTAYALGLAITARAGTTTVSPASGPH